MIIIIKDVFKPKWTYRRHQREVHFTQGFRSPMFRRNEALYLQPAKQAVPEKQTYLMNCLDRSFRENSGHMKTSSGLGQPGNSNSWLSGIYQAADPFFAAKLAKSRPEIFPVRKLYNLVEEYNAVWNENVKGTAFVPGLKKNISERRGPFPFVDDNISVLRELKPRDIFYTRARPREWKSPIWQVHQWWRRRHFGLYIERRRAMEKAAKTEIAAKKEEKKKK